HDSRQQGARRRDDDVDARSDRERSGRRTRFAGRRSAAHAGTRVGAAAAMKPAPFDYVRPTSLDEALDALAEAGDEAKVLAGGPIAHADAAAELPLCLAVLGGSVVVASPAGRREIAAGDFFVTHFTTTLAPGELVVETRWQAPAGAWGYAFEEFSQRRGDFGL